MKGRLVLEDGSVFSGVPIGAGGERIGEVVLNTAVVGYQELVSDPANAGRIVVLTYPLIGNYGAAKKFAESPRSWAAALVVKELSRMYSNWQAEGSFENFLAAQGLCALGEVDTRTLAVAIRDRGEMLGMIAGPQARVPQVVKRLQEHKRKAKRNWIEQISIPGVTKAVKGPPHAPKIGILDLGLQNSLLGQLADLGCSVTLLPYNIEPHKVMIMDLDGLIVSNGPEDDEALPLVAKTVRLLLGKRPLLGVSTGHQVIALSLGGRLKKMKNGHHGVNYPVRPADSWKGEITVQNHSWIVDEASLKKAPDLEITLRNVNDHTIEEMIGPRRRFISIQYYPARPGPGETHPVFSRFLDLVRPKRGN